MAPRIPDTVKQWGLVIVIVPIVLDSVFGFLAKVGTWQPAPVPVAAAVTEAQLREIGDRNFSRMEAIGNLVAEIHSGSAPRDYQQVPLWHGIKEELKKLREAIDRQTRASYRVAEALESNGGTKATWIEARSRSAKPVRVSEPEPEKRSWWSPRRWFGS